jgi:hypothetical protein
MIVACTKGVLSILPCWPLARPKSSYAGLLRISIPWWLSCQVLTQKKEKNHTVSCFTQDYSSETPQRLQNLPGLGKLMPVLQTATQKVGHHHEGRSGLFCEIIPGFCPNFFLILFNHFYIYSHVYTLFGPPVLPSCSPILLKRKHR